MRERRSGGHGRGRDRTTVTMCSDRPHRSLLSARSFLASLLIISVALLALPDRTCLVSASDDYYSESFDDYYQKTDDGKNANNDDGNGDDLYQNGDDKYKANSNYYNPYGDDDLYDPYDTDDGKTDDAAAAAEDDAAAAAADDDYYNDKGDDDVNDDYYSNQYKQADDGYKQQEQSYKENDDDIFYWNANVGFDGVSVMPLSCINYNNGHMIKFQLFDTKNSYQCHFSEISTFVVSIAHYMRAYFNYRALVDGQNFNLPSDAAYLNCMQLQDTYGSGQVVYAKVGCMERETFTSTKLQLHLYRDAQCSQLYDDGQTAKQRARNGYKFRGRTISSQVSFRPPFYSCLSCKPEEVSGTFNKKNSNWYDDDYISTNGRKKQQQQQNQNNNNQNNNDQNDDAAAAASDDKYMASNDDVTDDANNNANNNNNNANSNKYAYNQYQYNYNNGYNKNYGYNNGGNYNRYYNNYGGGGNRNLITAMDLTAPAALQAYHDEFWREYDEMMLHRSLYDNYYDVGQWNMCQRVYKYGLWCDEECRSLDFFRTDMWSGADVFLLVVMSVFLTAMMLLVVAKRLKAQSRAKLYGDDQPLPGLPPLGMAIIFSVTMAVIVTLAKLKFINETLVFAVVTCILLFIYMLKLTLFENRRPVLLAAPRNDMFDNPLDEHLFD